MKLHELISKLNEIAADQGDLDVLVNIDYQTQQTPCNPTVQIAEENQYPADWNMPEGFKFVELFVDN